MKELKYYLIDVFTNEMFGGNQLAVFPNGSEVPVELMQRLARELNLSETTYVLPPKNNSNDAWVRIFTPGAELPMAGHPTVGTAHVLAQHGHISKEGTEWEIVFEEGVGDIPVNIKLENGSPKMITMTQPLPEFGPELSDRELVAKAISLEEGDLDPDYPVEIVSCGVPFALIPIRDLATIRRAILRLDVWDEHFRGKPGEMLMLFTPEVENTGSTLHSRMFAPSVGIIEDPATGAASGPLGSYAAKHGIVSGTGLNHVISEQGIELGRPSFIHIGIEEKDGEISSVKVGGECVPTGEGLFRI